MARQPRFFGVVRHAERADAPFAFTNGMRWCVSEDFYRWPLDPPLSDEGVRRAPDIARLIQDFAGKDLSRRLTVVSSPYTRCIQTAALICQAMGHKGRLLVDLALGEVYGPTVMGGESAPVATRPLAEMVYEGLPHGLLRRTKVLGEWPSWPEDLRDARKRYAARFLKYLSRSYKTQRDFLLVSHADCVATALTMMPSHAAQVVARVDYGGMFLARSQPRWRFAPPARPAQAQRLLASVVRCGGGRAPSEEQASDDEDWIVNGAESEDMDVPAAVSEGWEVQPHGIQLNSKGEEQLGANEAARRNDFRMRRLSRGSDLGLENIELLLGGMGPCALGDRSELGSSTMIFAATSERSTRSGTSCAPQQPGSALGGCQRGKEETPPRGDAAAKSAEQRSVDAAARSIKSERRRALPGGGAQAPGARPGGPAQGAPAQAAASAADKPPEGITFESPNASRILSRRQCM